MIVSMSKTLRFFFRGMSVLVGVATYAALLVFASAKNVETDEVQQRLVHFRGCDQIAVARRTHHGGGPCFRWERSHLATGATESCQSEVRPSQLPRCGALRQHLADMGLTTEAQRNAAEKLFYQWEDAYESAHHDRAEWVERRQEAEASGAVDERVAWSILNGFFSVLDHVDAHSRPCEPPSRGARLAGGPIDDITVERLHVYWLAHQLPAECLAP